MLQFKRALLATAITASLMVPLSAQAAPPLSAQAVLVNAVQTVASPSINFSRVAPGVTQDMMVADAPGVGMAWLPNGNLLVYRGASIYEYGTVQDSVVNGTPVLTQIAEHPLSFSAGSLSTAGTGSWGLTNGTDGLLYINGGHGVYQIDPATWVATQLSTTQGWLGIAALADGRIVQNSWDWQTNTWNIYLLDPVTKVNAKIYTTNVFVDDVEASSNGLIALALLGNANVFGNQVDIIDTNGTLVNQVSVSGSEGWGSPDGLSFGCGALFSNNSDGSFSEFTFSGPNYTGLATERVIVATDQGNWIRGDLSAVAPDGSLYLAEEEGAVFDNGVYVPTALQHGSHIVRLNNPSCDPLDVPPGVPLNIAPIADAGLAQTVEATGATTMVALSGSATDANGDPLSYLWKDAAGNTVATTAAAQVALPVGVNTLTLVVSDGRGKTGSSTLNVTVQDTTAPVITAPAAVTVVATGAQTAVTLTTPVASDLFPVTFSNPPLTFPVGTTVVTWVATDAYGNSSTTTQSVTVNAPNVATLTAAGISALTAAQLALLTPAQLASLTPVQVVGLSLVQLATLTAAQLASLTPVQVGSMTAANRNLVNTMSGVCSASAPSVSASLSPYSHGDDGHDSDEGRFIIHFSGTGGGTSLKLGAELIIAGYGALSVSNGQMIEFEYENEKTEVEVEGGHVEIEAPSMVLRVTASDACDYTASVEAHPEGLSADNDDDYDPRDDHDD